MYSLSDTHDYLLKHSIKPSVQRTAIMGFLLENRTHPTVDEIYVALNPVMPTLSKTTVYNTLALFAERGAVRVLTIDDRNTRYDVEVSAHAHFMCRSCGKVYDLFNVRPEVFELPKSEGFTIENAEISYTGVCAKCKSAN